MLPARLPVVLLNGASGIAVGMATEIPPPQPERGRERGDRDDPRSGALASPALMKHIKGPDFPGGGQIITPRAEVKEAYTSGRGSVRVRARWTIERLARGQWQLVVHELPPGASARKVLEEIDAHHQPAAQGGQEVAHARAAAREAADAVDAGQGARRVAIARIRCGWCSSRKTSRIDENEFVNLLLAKTSMETQRRRSTW